MVSAKSPVKALFDLPESIHKIGFVQILSQAVERPEDTAATYVVTPKILEAFDKALKLVGNALQTGRSQASYLHGSFGSGKSHFMAVLSLMLKENEAVWRMPEFHGLRDKHGFIGKKKLLEMHFHMVGSDSLEEAIFTKYIDYVKTHHPEATIPGLFADEELFDNARRLLDEIGEEAFFKPMNSDADEDWGALGAGWDRARFEAAAESTDLKEREKLFSALVSTRFTAFAQERGKFIDFDTGLAVIGRHAKELGFDGIILFLDELILWLASRASMTAWLHNEVQKMVKLVESQESNREIPFVSFIARQRDLKDMVGEEYAGVENARLHDSLSWSEGRYDTITLQDRDLVAIAEKRVLKLKAPKEGEKVLDEAFDKMRRAAGASWQTLLGDLDASEFRKLYPFSPALVQALVALSNSLQRERTAIKLLTELLVEHIEDLEMGEVVGVGDLFDLLAGGEDTADGVMKSRFESAKQIYGYQLLPIIQESHGTKSAEKCQRERPDHAARIGCSNCPEKACRTDNRLVKTLLIAALVPEVPVLKEMTASRLVQLNHGSLKVPIAGTEASIATQKLKNWASQIFQLQVGNQADPTVRVVLEAVDIGPILERAARADSAGARQRVLKNVLFEALGVEPIADLGRDYSIEWRGTKRLGHIRFGNVRRLGPENLRCPEGQDWRLVVDYPFDDPGFGPHDDEVVIEKFLEEEQGSWTLVWLPHFFSDAINEMLKDLVILEHILESSSKTREYVSDLSVENQARAINDLQNARSSKKTKLLQVLEKAYGLAQIKEDDRDIDHAQKVDQHLVMLKPGAKIQPRIAANLSDALDAFVPEILAARYPRHPRFTKRLTPRRIEDLVKRFGEIIDADDKRIPADRALVEEMRGTLGELGLVRVTETAVHLLEDRLLLELEKKRNQLGVERPEVGEVRRWIDASKKMGLDDHALDLVVRCYARFSARTFVDADRPFEPKANKVIPDYVVLEKPALPSQSEWSAALEKASAMFDVKLPGKALHADNLKRFEGALAQGLKDREAITRLPGLLKQRARDLEIDEKADRIVTAASADSLAASLAGKAGKEMAEILATFEPKTSALAVGTSIATAQAVVAVLEESLIFGAFDQLRRLGGEEAKSVLERAAQALRQDEVNVGLAGRLKALAKEAQKILNPPKPDRKVVVSVRLSGAGQDGVVSALTKALDQVKAAGDEHEDVELSGYVELTVPKE